jgi:hypothetical protein
VELRVIDAARAMKDMKKTRMISPKDITENSASGAFVDRCYGSTEIEG